MKIRKILSVLFFLMITLAALQAQNLPTGVTIEPFYDTAEEGLSFRLDKLTVIGMAEVPGLPQHFLVIGMYGYLWTLYPDTTDNYDPHGQNYYYRVQIADFNEKSMKGWEQGAMAGAFDPHFTDNHYYYLLYQKYTDPQFYHGGVTPNQNDGPGNPGTIVLERWIMSEDYRSIEMDTTLLEVDHGTGYGTHHMSFGKDNNLYLSLDSYSKNSWDLSDLERKVLCIDVSRQDPGLLYAIPPTNPFYNSTDPDIRKEIYAWGFRNDWPVAADYITGKVWTSEIGQVEWEEVNILQPGGNYGWADGGDGQPSNYGAGIEGPCSENTTDGYVFFRGVRQDPYSYQGPMSGGELVDCSKLVNGTWSFSHNGLTRDGIPTSLPGLQINSIAIGPTIRGDTASPFYGYHFMTDINRMYFVALKEGEDPQEVGGIPDGIRFSSYDPNHNGPYVFAEDSYGHQYVIMGSSSSNGSYEWHDIYRITHPELTPLSEPRYQVHPLEGCTDNRACNYNIAASDDDGSCLYTNDNTQACDCPTFGGCPLGVQYHVDSPGITVSRKMVSVVAQGRHSVEIRNVNGDLVYSQSGNGPCDYSLSGFPPGVYMVEVVTPEVVRTKRILFY